jgi:antitoxin VapB
LTCLYKMRKYAFTLSVKTVNAMPLNIRDPRAHALAKQLAARRGSTMTEAIVTALENELRREREQHPLPERLAILARQLRAAAGPNGREMSKDEIDEMWGG